MFIACLGRKKIKMLECLVMIWESEVCYIRKASLQNVYVYLQNKFLPNSIEQKKNGKMFHRLDFENEKYSYADVCVSNHSLCVGCWTLCY